ncbi:MAG: hypothetical protein HC802_00135 [Caldilineaceae bacterium]|nr:hypothetical protein [Caldilineaceae bacterium]
MNHFAYIRIAQEYGAASRFVLTHYPGRYLVRMKKALILYRQSIWNIDLYRDSLMAANIRAIDRYLPLKSGNSIVGIYHLLALCMTLYLVLKALWQLARLGRSSLQASILFMVMTIWYVTMISVSSEYGENARFRAQIDPILFTVFVIGIADFWANIVRLLPKRTPKLATG